MDELKPCPFCGGEAKIGERKETSAFSGELNTFYVICIKCGCAPFPQYTENLYYKSEWREIAEQLKQDAINAWNRRPGHEPDN